MKYTDKTKSYVRSAIDGGCLLKILESQQDGSWRTVKSCAENLKNNSSQELKIATFTRWLQMWSPFIVFLQYIKTGHEINIAARKLCSRFSFSHDNPEVVTKLLFRWAKNCKFMNTKGELLFSSQNTEKSKLLDVISLKLTDDARARMYLAEELGEEIFDWLQADEIHELINALLKCKESPRETINATGRALEDILKRICIDLLGLNAQDLKKKNGISELGNYLYSKNFIDYKHNHIITAQGGVRNMASHGKEIMSMEKWKITSTSAAGSLFSTFALIRSLFHYVKYNNEFLY